MNEEAPFFLFILFIVIVVAIGYYGIYNPIIKVSQGCWSWERQVLFSNHTLLGQGYSCSQIRDWILLDNYPDHILLTTKYTYCHDKLLEEENYTAMPYGFKQAYLKEC